MVVILIPQSREKNLGLTPTELDLRCFASLNSPQDESAVADMTMPFMREFYRR